ncbi:MAG: hypothetical protein ACXAD7_20360 [Candidatus Kariarchaeaceae archaeon]|jgi:hypothetical protein
MEKILGNLITNEKIRQIRIAIVFAAIASLMILSISFGISNLAILNFDNDGDPPNGPNGNNNGGSFVLGLNNYMTQRYDEISHLAIGGNYTPSIHPNLIYSEINYISNEDLWEVNASVTNETYYPDAVMKEFNFSSEEVFSAHESFLESLSNTSEVNSTDLPTSHGSIPNLLIYTVFYLDGTGLEFAWLGFENINVVAVANVTWSGQPTTTSTVSEDPPTTTTSEVPTSTNITSSMILNLNSNSQVSFNYYSGESKYISPLSAFDSFINQLNEMFGPHLAEFGS